MMTLRAVVLSALLSSFMVSVLAHSAAADTLLVSNRGDATVQLIDTETGETVSTIKAGVGAHEFAVSPDGRVIVGSCYGSGPRHQVPDQRLVVVNLDAPDDVRMIDLGDHPRPNDLRFHPDGRHVGQGAHHGLVRCRFRCDGHRGDHLCRHHEAADPAWPQAAR